MALSDAVPLSAHPPILWLALPVIGMTGWGWVDPVAVVNELTVVDHQRRRHGDSFVGTTQLSGVK
jgi:hypothetical protein